MSKLLSETLREMGQAESVNGCFTDEMTFERLARRAQALEAWRESVVTRMRRLANHWEQHGTEGSQCFEELNDLADELEGGC